MVKVNIFWFRRDLRLDDNKGLSHATKSKYPVLPIFIFDSDITNSLPVNDKRVNFIYDQLQKINNQLNSKFNSSLQVFKDKPIEVFKRLNSEFNINSVYCNHDYEPYSIKRDKSVESYLDSKDSKFLSFKDQVIFEKSEVVKNDGNPYVVRYNRTEDTHYVASEKDGKKTKWTALFSNGEWVQNLKSK